MSVRKRNEFLEGDESEADLENGYGSEAEEGRGAIVNKRRKVDHDEDISDDDISEEDKDEPEQGQKAGKTDSRFDFSHFEDEDPNDPDDHSDEEQHSNNYPPPSTTTTPKASKSTSQSKDLKAYEKSLTAHRKSGVIYLSRIPPFMKPQTLRHYLLPHAPRSGLGRIFLTPEAPATHRKRLASGGNKKKSYTDGWVEFHSKREAKLAAETLNGQLVGGKKGGWYHDDLWNVRYLRGFKWGHLTEQIAGENAERQARLREEVRVGRKANREFVEGVERGKVWAGRERKRAARRGKEEGEEREEGEEGEEKAGRREMKFKQKRVRDEGERERVAEEFRRGEGVRKKIF